jgi:S-(hydroxymethyl)glutathione dehydrogenase/alcohol dehydrogenase
VSIYTLPIHFNKILTGSQGGSSRPHIDIPRIMRLANARRISFEGIITDEFTLDQVNTALDKMRSGRCGRILLKINGAD